MIWDLFDLAIAEELKMSVKDYITYIESLSEEEATTIINPIIDKIFKETNE